MKKTLIIAAVILGFSASGFSQSETRNSNTLSSIGSAAFTNSNIIEESTGKQFEIIIENENVTVVPGETVIIYTEGTDKVIAVKNNGEYIGELRQRTEWIANRAAAK